MADYKQTALHLLSTFGQADTVLNFLQRLPVDLTSDPSRMVDPRIRDYTAPSDGSTGTVLLPLFPSYQVNEDVQSILARAFHTRGVDTLQVRCDEALPACCLDNVMKYEGAMRSICRFNTSQVSESFGLEAHSARDFLPSDYAPPALSEGYGDARYRGVDVSKLCFASARDYFKKYNVDPRDDRERAVLDRYRATAVTLLDAYDAIFDAHDISAVVAFEDHYVYGGTALALAAERSIPAYSVDLGYLNETLLFGRWGNRNSLPMFTDHETLTSVLREPLDDDQESAIDELMRGRMDGTTTRFQYSAQTDKSIQRPDDVTTVGMFTNLSWDASAEIDDAAFRDMFDWISTTIEAVGDRPGLHLVVKTHPAEAVRSTREPVGEWIHDNLGPLPDNVEVLPPDTDVNTYRLASDLDLAAVYSSIVGLEMAYLGLPVVVAGDTHYRDLGITADPRTREEYVEYVTNASPVPTDPDRAKRYAHFFYFSKHVPFPFVASDPDGENIRLLPVSHDDLVPGNEALDRITEAVLAGEPVLAE